MKIQLLISVGGTTFSHVPRDIVDWADEAAQAYIDAGYAVAVVEPAPDSAPDARPAKRGR